MLSQKASDASNENKRFIRIRHVERSRLSKKASYWRLRIQAFMSLRPQLSPILRCLSSYSSLIHPNLYRLRQITTTCIVHKISSKPSPRQFSTYRILRIQDNSQKDLQQNPITATKPSIRENIYTIPNLLTVSRILACPILGWSILHDDFHLATGVLVYAGISDLVCLICLAMPFISTHYTSWAIGRWVFGP